MTLDYTTILDEFEQRYRVNIDSHDENGQTYVYRYVNGTCIRVEFDSMSPSIQHIEAAAKAIMDLAEKLS
jgi:hypothetical protein